MTPFSVLHLCMGNICRSPMAERLTVLAARAVAGDAADELLYVHSAGTGDWHVGEDMNPPAAEQIRRRGGDVSGFVCRTVAAADVAGSDLVLTATERQHRVVLSRWPAAAGKTFVLGQFGRLLREADLSALPAATALSAEAVRARGEALVRAVDAARGGARPLRTDDLDDPWGYEDAIFARVADEIEASVRPLVAALLG